MRGSRSGVWVWGWSERMQSPQYLDRWPSKAGLAMATLLVLLGCGGAESDTGRENGRFGPFSVMAGPQLLPRGQVSDVTHATCEIIC